MRANLFKNVSVDEGNPKWKQSILRERRLYRKKNDIRSEFERDYTRILHCLAYRRLKHKTQVFFAPRNDHICTRIEHVNHVASVSHMISKFLGLNTQLTAAISIGHDLGHAPFGHAGEKCLGNIVEDRLHTKFWHEKNSLRFIDKIETLPDTKNSERNLNLTYAVRDGIISHCGEVDENSLRPRDEAIDLNLIEEPNKYPPFTWEGCVVKLSDKISYLGRDIEDAVMLGILTTKQLRELRILVNAPIKKINNTILMHDFIIDICNNSSPKSGISFSQKHLDFINSVKKFNNDNIYFHDRLKNYKKYVELVLTSIFESHMAYYKSVDTLSKLNKDKKTYPLLTRVFRDWLLKYSNITELRQDIRRHRTFKNLILYDIRDEKDYVQAVIDYISGMTDNFALKIFEELRTF